MYPNVASLPASTIIYINYSNLYIILNISKYLTKMKVMTLQNHYSMNIIKYKVKYILYLKIFYRERKRGCLLLFWGKKSIL